MYARSRLKSIETVNPQAARTRLPTASSDNSRGPHHSSFSQATFWGCQQQQQQEPCASETTVSLGCLPSRRQGIDWQPNAAWHLALQALHPVWPCTSALQNTERMHACKPRRAPVEVTCDSAAQQEEEESTCKGGRQQVTGQDAANGDDGDECESRLSGADAIRCTQHAGPRQTPQYQLQHAGMHTAQGACHSSCMHGSAHALGV